MRKGYKKRKSEEEKVQREKEGTMERLEEKRNESGKIERMEKIQI
jgi:hypothetical protein